MKRREQVIYEGETFHVQSTGRYFQSGRKDAPERLLHRRIWADRNGAIPEGKVVHHRDGNWRNNAIENLELQERRAHARAHLRDRISRDPGYQLRNLAKAQAAAPEWHASPDGLAWHSTHGKATWETRQRKSYICARCGVSFDKHDTGHKVDYCSSACAQAIGVLRYFDSKRTCLNCGSEFIANRHRKTMYCSRTCSNRSRHPTGHP
jgi:HNH endonuclease